MVVHFVSLQLFWMQLSWKGQQIKIFSNSAIQLLRANKHMHGLPRTGRNYCVRDKKNSIYKSIMAEPINWLKELYSFV